MMAQVFSSRFTRRSIAYATTVTLLAYSGWSLLPFQSVCSFSSSGISILLQLKSIGFIGTLLAMGFVGIFVPHAFEDPRHAIRFGTLALLIGYSMLYTMSYLTYERTALLGCVAIIIGVGTAVLFAMWSSILYGDSLDMARRQITAGTALMTVIYLLLVFIDNVVLQGLAIILLIAINFVLLLPEKQTMQNDESKILSESLVSVRNSIEGLASSLWRYALCIAVVAYASGVAQGLVPREHSFLLNLILLLGMLLSAMAISLFKDVFKRNLSFQQIYSIILLIVVTSLVLVPVLNEDARLIVAGICFFAFSILSILMVLTCLKAAKLRDMNPIAVLGLFAGFVYLLSSLGTVLTKTPDGTLGDARVLVIALSAIYLVSLVGVVTNFFRNRGENDPYSFQDDMRPEQDADTRACSNKDEIEESIHSQIGRNTAETNGDGRLLVHIDLIPICCQALKKRYLLSNRETEVLELLVRGRDVSHIADTLFVSQSTVRSHFKSLYRKLGVHSKQQVLDVFDEEMAQLQ